MEEHTGIVVWLGLGKALGDGRSSRWSTRGVGAGQLGGMVVGLGIGLGGAVWSDDVCALFTVGRIIHADAEVERMPDGETWDCYVRGARVCTRGQRLRRHEWHTEALGCCCLEDRRWWCGLRTGTGWNFTAIRPGLTRSVLARLAVLSCM